MALIDDILLSAKGPNTLKADYTGSDTFSFVDGIKRSGPDTDGTELPFPYDQSIALEIHDGDYDPIYEDPKTRPLIRWKAVADAIRYKIYHTPPGGSESLIYEQPDIPDKINYQIDSPVECSTGWHRFRVEAVKLGLIESTTLDWPFRVYDIPPLVSDMSIAGTSPNFTITITP